MNHKHSPNSTIAVENSRDLEGLHFLCQSHCDKMGVGKQLLKDIANGLHRIFKKKEGNSNFGDSSELSSSLSDYEDSVHENTFPCSFEESIALMESRDDNKPEMPENLPVGILVDQIYLVSPNDLNVFLFAPNSQFSKDMAELQGTTNVQEGPWTWKNGDTSCLTRVVTYMKAATKLIKAVNAIEEQTYIRVSRKEFAILVSVSTPEVPYGNSFRIELLYKIMPGEVSSGEESSHLVVSWGIVFLQSTMMKGMIEGGARQGLKESFSQFSDQLARNFKVLDKADLPDKEHLLATLQTEDQWYWWQTITYFWNFTVASTIFMFLYVLVHILRCGPNLLQGLEFSGLELPDSFGELITSGILIIQLQRVYNMVSHFVQARFQMGK